MTVTGLGGVGKSRLAREWAGRYDGERPLYIADLVETRDVEGLGRSLASAIGVELPGCDTTDDALRHIATCLSHGGGILVLDNVDAVPEGPAALRSCLAEALGWRILSTSRLPLGLEGERTIELGPLSIDEGAEPSEAAQLFRRLAAVHDPDPLSTASADARIAELVRELDGLPLALELAAGLLAVLDLDELRLRVGVGAALPGGGPDEKRRSLDRVLAEAWEQLDEPLRSLLVQITAFRGSFTAELAEQVAAGCGDVLSGLAELRRRGLITARRDANAPHLRLEVLRTVRALLERRERAPDVAARERHARVFAGFSRPRVAELDGTDGRRAASELRAEEENLEAARDWLEARANEAGPLDLAEILGLLSAHYERLLRWGPAARLGRLLDVVEPLVASSDLPAELRAHALVVRGRFERVCGRSEAARRALLSGAEAAAASSQPELHALALANLGYLGYLSGAGDAEAVLARALDSAERAGTPRLVGIVAGSLHLVARSCGALSKATRYLSRALDALDAAGDRRHYGLARAHEGVLRRLADDTTSSAEQYRRGLRIVQETGDRLYEGMILSEMGSLAHERGELDEATDAYQQAERALEAVGARRDLALARAGRAAVAAELGRVDIAAESFDACDRRLRELGDDGHRKVVRLLERRVSAGSGLEEPPASPSAAAAAWQLAVRVARASGARRGKAPAPAVRQSTEVVVAMDGGWFRRSDGARVDLSAHRARRLLLAALARRHEAGIEQGASVSDLIEAGWPGEQMLAQSGASRVYVAIAALRKLGLRRALVRGEDGYRLVDVRVVRGGED